MLHNERVILARGRDIEFLTPISHPLHTHFTPISHPFHTRSTPISHPFHTRFTPSSHPFHTHFTLASHPLLARFQKSKDGGKFAGIGLRRPRVDVSGFVGLLGLWSSVTRVGVGRIVRLGSGLGLRFGIRVDLRNRVRVNDLVSVWCWG